MSGATLPFFQEPRSPKHGDVLAFLFYVVVASLLFGLPVLNDPTHYFIGNGVDATEFIWFLAWWPYAIVHWLNPLVTHVVWAPTGFNLAWGTAIPGLSLAASPITLIFGPVVTYNILSLLAPSLAAWAAYLLCRGVTKAFYASLIAGALFGFSTYEVGHVLFGQLNLSFVFLVPLGAHLVLRFITGAIGVTRFITLLTGLLVFQFLISVEIFTSMTVLGGFMMVLAFFIMPSEMRRRLVSTSLAICYAYVLAGITLSPYLWSMLATDFPKFPITWPGFFSSDLLNFFFPTMTNLIGALLPDPGITGGMFLGRSEAVAYLGVPLLLIIVRFTMMYGRTPVGKLLIGTLCVVLFASLGPTLHVAGVSVTPLPWKWLLRAPLINHILPVRLMLFAFLLAAIMVAIWCESKDVSRWERLVYVVLAIVFLFPNTSSQAWRSGLGTPRFFSAGIYKHYLSPGENVVIIPYAQNGFSMLWQAQTNMYFRMAGGFVGVTPVEFRGLPIVQTFYSGVLPTDYRMSLKAFVRDHSVTAVIVDKRSAGPWRQLFSALQVTPFDVGDIFLYKLASMP